MTWFLGLDAVVRRVLVIVSICLILLVVLLTVGFCRSRDAEKQANNATTQAEGRTVSAVEAINTINDLGERSDATDAEVESAVRAINNAPPDQKEKVWREQIACLQGLTSCDDGG